MNREPGRICYEYQGSIAVFSPQCPNCGRFIKAGNIRINGLDKIEPGNNAACSKCGEIHMEFEGWYDPEDFDPPIDSTREGK